MEVAGVVSVAGASIGVIQGVTDERGSGGDSLTIVEVGKADTGIDAYCGGSDTVFEFCVGESPD